MPRIQSGDPLILIYLFQLGHEHQLADAQAVQLFLPFGQDRRAGTHMARDNGAQLRIVRGHQARDLGELGRVAGESQDRQVGLVDRGVERQVADQGGVAIVEDGETILESDEERRGRTAIGTRRKRVVVGARSDFKRNAFQDESIANSSPPELLLLESFFDEPVSQRTWSNDRGARQRGDFDRISHIVVVRVRHEDEISASQAVQRNGPIRVGEPRAGDHDHALGRGQTVEFVAEPFNLDFPLPLRWRLGKADCRLDKTPDNEANRKNSASNETDGSSAKHVCSPAAKYSVTTYMKFKHPFFLTGAIAPNRRAVKRTCALVKIAVLFSDDSGNAAVAFEP